MTFEQLVEIINDPTKTPYQKAADLHAMLHEAPQPSRQPVKQRKMRTTKPKPPTTPHASLQSISSNHDNEA